VRGNKIVIINNEVITKRSENFAIAKSNLNNQIAKLIFKPIKAKLKTNEAFVVVVGYTDQYPRSIVGAASHWSNKLVLSPRDFRGMVSYWVKGAR
jgi:hypothetical protein